MLKGGIIGCGFFAANHLAAWQLIDGAAIVAVCDQDPARARAAGAAGDGARVFDDAATMLRTMMALAKVDGRVCAFLEPIALYMTKDLHEPGDGGWLTEYPSPDQAMPLGEGRVYGAEKGDGSDLVIFSFGNGVPMSLRAAKSIAEQRGWSVRVVDLRWLQPLNENFIAGQAAACKRILVVDEGRRSAGVGEGIITAIVEAGQGGKPLKRVVGADTYTPLAGAAFLVLPSDADIVSAALSMD